MTIHAGGSPGAAPIGHEWALEVLRRSLGSGRGGHAYLLTGPAHVGKFTTALAMARLLLCAAGTGCGECRHCRLVQRRVHPDLHVLEVPADRRTIPIKDVHDFVHGMALRPLEAARAVYIIRDADDLAEDGANALLKTLEEPPPAVTLLLTAPDASALLETVVSRCQVLTLRPVPIDLIAAHLMEVHQLAAARSEALARASDGRPGWALRALADPELLAVRERRAADLLALLDGSRLDRLQAAGALAGRWSGHADDVRDTLSIWTDIWRDLLRLQHGLASRVGFVALHAELARLSQELTLDEVCAGLEATLQAADGLARNAHPRLCLEAYALLLPRPRRRGASVG